MPARADDLERLAGRGVSSHLPLAILDRRIAVIAEQRTGLVAALARLRQRHLGIRSDDEPLFPVRKPVFQPPGFVPPSRDEEIKAARIGELVILVARRGLAGLDISDRHGAPIPRFRAPEMPPSVVILEATR